jgi:hypothetical protein
LIVLGHAATTSIVILRARSTLSLTIFFSAGATVYLQRDDVADNRLSFVIFVGSASNPAISSRLPPRFRWEV